MDTKLYETVAAALRVSGVRHIFGIPGTQTVRFYEALRRARMPATLVAHESGAAFAAAGWFRASGELAAASVIPGPGFTNALTAVAEAQHDSAAMLLITEAPLTIEGRHHELQAIDQTAIAGPLVKATYRAADRESAAEIVALACETALGGEPGPVLLEIGGRPLEMSPPVATAPLDVASLQEAARRLSAARRPVVYCGQGAAAAAEQTRALVARLGCPVVSTTSGRGVISEANPLNVRFEAVTGASAALNSLLEEADVILVLGAKLGHNGSAGFAVRLPPERLIRIDADGNQRERNYPADLFIAASCEQALPVILDALEPVDAGWSAADIQSRQTAIVAETRELLTHEPALIDAPAADWSSIFALLRREIEDDAIVVTDSGHHQVLARTYWEVRWPRSLLLPADFQSMAYALPTALGAGKALPGRRLVVMVGDGGLLMHGMELTTLVREGLPLTVILFSDGRLGQIDAMQAGYSGVSFQTELPAVDWRAWCGALGLGYSRLSADLEASVSHALCAPGLLDLRLGDSGAMKSRRRKSRLKHPLKRAIQR